MTKNQLKNLHHGDEITWNDPDGGECSITDRISRIEFHGEIVGIHWLNGDYTEAFPSEIS